MMLSEVCLSDVCSVCHVHRASVENREA